MGGWEVALLGCVSFHEIFVALLCLAHDFLFWASKTHPSDWEVVWSLEPPVESLSCTSSRPGTCVPSPCGLALVWITRTMAGGSLDVGWERSEVGGSKL